MEKWITETYLPNEESKVSRSTPPDRRSASSLLAAIKECGRSRDLQRGRQLHASAIESGLLRPTSTPRILNSLIAMYSKCGSMTDARRNFDASHIHTVVSWTCLMWGYIASGESELALELFDRMKPVSADARAFVAALAACADLALSRPKQSLLWFESARAIHRRASAALSLNVFVECAAITAFARCGQMQEARRVFHSLPQRSVVAWNALLQGYVDNGEGEIALALFGALEDRTGDAYVVPNARTFVAVLGACAAIAERQRASRGDVEAWVLERGRSIDSKVGSSANMFVENTLVDMYSKCGRMDHAQRVFDRMTRPTVMSWTALITGYVDNGGNDLALRLLASMDLKGVNPNALTLVAAISACANLGALKLGRDFHVEASERGVANNVVVANSLIYFYGKCGNMDLASRVFDSIAEQRSVVSWNSLMGGFSMNGDYSRTLDLFSRMREQGILPNAVTFVCLLTSCSHAGLTNKGRELFEAMRSEYGIAPTIQHYNCMVDLLARANCLNESITLVRNMPLEPNAVTWTAILDASRKWKNSGVEMLAYNALMLLKKKKGRKCN